MSGLTTRGARALVALGVMLVLASGAAAQSAPLVFIGNGAVPYVVTEGGATTVSVPVTLNQASSGQVTVDWHTQSAWFQRTASDSGSHVDYQATGGKVVFAPGERSKTVTVSIFDDAFAEEDESFVVALDNPVGAQIGVPDDFWTHGAVVTIHDNELGAFIGEGGYTLYADEGDSGTTPFQISLRLNFAAAAPVSVDWATGDAPFAEDPATPDQDYQAANGTVVFAPGETSKTIEVGIIGDTLHEPGEQFGVSITDVVGAQKGLPWDDSFLPARVEIRDDDPEAPPPGGPCIVLSTASVAISGTASTPSTPRHADSEHLTAHNCGDSAVHLDAHGTDASGTAGSWELTSSPGSVCNLGVNVFRAQVTLFLAAAQAATGLAKTDTPLVGADATTPFTLGAAADQELSIGADLPCEGSVGLGDPMTTNVTLTAVAP
jgi:Calx-beta domain